jgi:predicted transcriptional regulator
MATVVQTPKQEAHKLIDRLPDTATWDDVVYEMAVRRSIERGLADADAGRLTDVKDVRREFGLPE